MAQIGYTPIKLYNTATASAAPLAANLAAGELAINTNDGKLYYKDSSGNVQVLASKASGTIGGSTTQIQYNNAGALAGSATFTFNGTNVTAASLVDSGFFIVDDADTTKKAQFQLSGFTTATTNVFTLPDATTTFAGLSVAQTFSAANTFSSTVTMSGTTTNLLLGSSQTSGDWTAGGTSQTGIITLGRSTVSQTLNIGTGATTAVSTKTINIGTAGVASSTTNITIGSAVAGALGTTTLNSTVLLSKLTASQAVFTDASKNLISNAITGTGSVVMSSSPTITTPVINGAVTGTLTFTSLTASSLTSGRVTYAGTSGLLQDSANLTFDGTNLSVSGATIGLGIGGSTSNAILGYGAFASNTTGTFNVAIGYNALNSLTGGYSNVAVGASALRAITNGYSNVAVGNNALLVNSSGYSNVAIGYNTLTANSSGYSNVAIGNNALTSAVGIGNTAIGDGALSSISTGNRNTAIGNNALLFCSSGTNNIEICGSFGPVFNITTQDNRLCMGNTSVTNAYVQVAWTVVSDARDKTDFAPVPHGLDFVTKLKPTAYRYKANREATEGHGPIRYGFKAQEVLELEGNTPVIVDAEDTEKLRFNDQSMIAVLVNAIQEQQTLIKNLTDRLAALEAK